jgi:excisionase family DNA binding protein
VKIMAIRSTAEQIEQYQTDIKVWARDTDESCEVISVEEAGRKLGIGRAAAYAHVKAGHIPTIRLGNRMLVPKAAFKRLLEKV